MFSRLVAFAVVLFLAQLPCNSLATVWHVLPDGSGDAPTIQAAVDSAQAGDVVSVGCGTYQESGLTMKSGVILRSEDLSQCVTLEVTAPMTCTGADASTSIHGFLFTVLAPSTTRLLEITDSSPVISNCTFQDGVGKLTMAGGILCADSSPTFHSCTIRNNWAPSAHSAAGEGGGLYCTGSSVTMTDCDILDNSAGGGGLPSGAIGGGVAAMGSDLTLTDCRISGNSASDAYQGLGGGIWSDGPVTATDCVFQENYAFAYGGPFSFGGSAVYCSGTLTATSCTFVGNDADSAGAVDFRFGTLGDCTFFRNSTAIQVIDDSGSPNVTNTIVAFSQVGPGVRWGTPVLSCCNVFGNAGGDWIGGIAGQETGNGNLSDWPRFCDPESGNLTLAGDSPCLPAANSCGVLIGALGQGCGPVHVDARSWGSIKAMYR